MLVSHRTIIDQNDVHPSVLMLDQLDTTDTDSLSSYGSGKTYVNLDESKTHMWGGGTVIEERELPVFDDIYTAQQQEDPTPVTVARMSTRNGGRVATRSPPAASTSRRPGRRSTVAVKEEDFAPEEMQKLMLRRERNKEAAARCRKRKLDQIESLSHQVEEWEKKNTNLQRELMELRKQHKELQHMLQQHNSICQMQQQQIDPTTVKVVGVDNNVAQWSEPVLRVPNVPTTINNNDKVVVKTEDCVMMDTSAHQTTEEYLNLPQVVANDPVVTTDVYSLGLATPVTTAPVVAKRSKPSRPMSLSLQVGAQNLRSIAGVPIETPTNIFSQLNFDALMDGRTGLTPTNILTPVAITSSVLSTPVLSSPTCSSQQARSVVSGLPGPDKNVKLVSL